MSRLTVIVGLRGGWALLALVAATVGLVLIVVAVTAQVRAPQPPRSVGRIDVPSPSSTAASSSGSSAGSASGNASVAPAAVAPLGASRPTTITIPAIGVHSNVLPIGLAPDGTLAVPQPGPNQDRAAWFMNSPTPGQPGPAIIEGHVDTSRGPSVFFKLGAVRPGNKIHVLREDGVEVVFTVNAVRDYQKAAFPTQVVYGAKDLSRPQLRLITCSDFDPSIRHHVGNEVVFAHLTAVHHPRASSGN
jgi:sortase (surface protein transpeptidase)